VKEVLISYPWAIFIKLLRKLSNLSENFKCIFPMKIFMLMKNYVFHKHARFIEEEWVKKEKHAFEFLSQD